MSMTELELQQAILAVMSHILQADGEMREEEMAQACQRYNAISGRNLTKRQLYTAIQMRRNGKPLFERLRDLKDRLEPADKVEIIKAGYQIAGSDDECAPAELRLLQEIGQCLDISAGDVGQIIAGQRS